MGIMPVVIGVTNVAGVVRVSYPANSTLVVKGTSSGKQFAKDTNTTSSAKAYIFLAPIGDASYTLTATNTAGKTTSKQVYVAKDQVQSVTLAYFSATIKITYPAKSTCVIKNSSGTQVGSDTNTGTAAKTWTVTVSASGTYTITATATSGGKTKSTTVSITADGQSKSVTLAYEIYYYDAGDQCISVTGGWKKVNGGNGGGTLTLGKSSMVALANWGQSVAGITINKINLSNIKTLTFNVTSTISGNAHCVVTTSQDFIFGEDAVVATVALNTNTKTYTLNTSSLTGSYYIAFGIDHGNELEKATVTVSSIYGKD